MSKFSPRKIVFQLCFFLASYPRSIGMPAFCGSKWRDVHTMAGRSGWGLAEGKKKLHCFTPKAEEFFKKVHDFVAKMPLF